MKPWDRKPDSWLQRIGQWRKLFAKTLQELTNKKVPAVAAARPPRGRTP
jgi:hypothetical protein